MHFLCIFCLFNTISNSKERKNQFIPQTLICQYGFYVFMIIIFPFQFYVNSYLLQFNKKKRTVCAGKKCGNIYV